MFPLIFPFSYRRRGGKRPFRLNRFTQTEQAVYRCRETAVSEQKFRQSAQSFRYDETELLLRSDRISVSSKRRLHCTETEIPLHRNRALVTRKQRLYCIETEIQLHRNRAFIARKQRLYCIATEIQLHRNRSSVSLKARLYCIRTRLLFPLPANTFNRRLSV